MIRLWVKEVTHQLQRTVYSDRGRLLRLEANHKPNRSPECRISQEAVSQRRVVQIEIPGIDYLGLSDRGPVPSTAAPPNYERLVSVLVDRMRRRHPVDDED